MSKLQLSSLFFIHFISYFFSVGVSSTIWLYMFFIISVYNYNDEISVVEMAVSAMG
jgi:hypothetical protein